MSFSRLEISVFEINDFSGSFEVHYQTNSSAIFLTSEAQLQTFKEFGNSFLINAKPFVQLLINNATFADF